MHTYNLQAQAEVQLLEDFHTHKKNQTVWFLMPTAIALVDCGIATWTQEDDDVQEANIN